MSKNGEKRPLIISHSQRWRFQMSCLTNSPKLKDIQFTIIHDKEKHQIFTFTKELERENFCLENNQNYYLIIKIVSMDWLIN